MDAGNFTPGRHPIAGFPPPPNLNPSAQGGGVPQQPPPKRGGGNGGKGRGRAQGARGNHEGVNAGDTFSSVQIKQN